MQCHRVSCVILYSMSPCILCCPVFWVTLYSVPPCTLCHPVFHVVLYCVTLYSVAPYVLGYPVLCCVGFLNNHACASPDSLVSTIRNPYGFLVQYIVHFGFLGPSGLGAPAPGLPHTLSMASWCCLEVNSGDKRNKRMHWQ